MSSSSSSNRKSKTPAAFSSSASSSPAPPPGVRLSTFLNTLANPQEANLRKAVTPNSVVVPSTAVEALPVAGLPDTITYQFYPKTSSQAVVTANVNGFKAQGFKMTSSSRTQHDGSVVLTFTRQVSRQSPVSGSPPPLPPVSSSEESSSDSDETGDENAKEQKEHQLSRTDTEGQSLLKTCSSCKKARIPPFANFKTCDLCRARVAKSTEKKKQQKMLLKLQERDEKPRIDERQFDELEVKRQKDALESFHKREKDRKRRVDELKEEKVEATQQASQFDVVPAEEESKFYPDDGEFPKRKRKSKKQKSEETSETQLQLDTALETLATRLDEDILDWAIPDAESASILAPADE